MRKLLLSFLLLASSQAFGAYSYSRTISIDYTKCGSASALSNFPVEVSISHATLKTAGNGGHISNTVTQAGGNGVTMPADMIFTSDSGGTVKIPWEVESYDAANGILVAWVKLANVSCTADTPFYLFYGDPGVTAQQNTGSYSPSNVWETGYKGVWHLAGQSSLFTKDSTANANDGTAVNSPAVAAGQIDGSASMVAASSQYVNIPSASSLDITGSVTLEAWIYGSTWQGSAPNINGIFDKGANVSANDAFGLRVGDSGTPGKVQFIVNNGTEHKLIYGAALSAGQWYHLAAVYDGANQLLYVNGSQVASAALSVTMTTTTQPLRIGYNYDGRYFDGKLDELRVSATNRSSNWILTEYNNQHSPGNIGADSFLKFGAESSGGAVARRRMLNGD